MSCVNVLIVYGLFKHALPAYAKIVPLSALIAGNAMNCLGGAAISYCTKTSPFTYAVNLDLDIVNVQ